MQAARGWPGRDRSLQSPAGQGPNPARGERASARADGSAGRGPGAPSCSAGLGRTAPPRSPAQQPLPWAQRGPDILPGPRGPGPSTSEGVASRPTARTRGRTQGHTATCTRMHTHLYTPVHPDSRWGAPPGKHRAVTCHAPPTSPRGGLHCCPTAPTETRSPSGTELVCPTEPVHARTHQALPLLCPTPSGRGTGYRKEMGRGLPGGGRKRRGGAPVGPVSPSQRVGARPPPSDWDPAPTPTGHTCRPPALPPAALTNRPGRSPARGQGPTRGFPRGLCPPGPECSPTSPCGCRGRRPLQLPNGTCYLPQLPHQRWGRPLPPH